MATRSFRPSKRRHARQSSEVDTVIQEAQAAARARRQGYRERSLALHGWICAKCAREFEASNLHLLTVHHKDGNHRNNPPDGSNWENLCAYCHDDEHQKSSSSGYHGLATPDSQRESPLGHNPFEGLDDLLTPED